MNLKAIIEAIGNVAKSAPDLMNRVTGVYLSLAPQKTAVFPFIIIDLISGPVEYTFCGVSEIENLTLSINVYSKSEDISESSEILEEVHAAYDNVTLEFAGEEYNSYMCMRTRVHPIREDDGVWHIVTNYRLVLGKVTTNI